MKTPGCDFTSLLLAMTPNVTIITGVETLPQVLILKRVNAQISSLLVQIIPVNSVYLTLRTGRVFVLPFLLHVSEHCNTDGQLCLSFII